MTPPDAPLVCVRPPGWIDGAADDAFAAIRDWTALAERLGFDGVFVGDRLLARADASGGVVYDASMLEATTLLAALAAETERVLLGPLVLVFPYRHAVQIAKLLATLDVISGGRMVLGAGIGWNGPEFEVLGIDPAGRGRRFEDDLATVRRLWAGEPVGDGVRVAPTPVQEGGPPVWIASFSPGSALDWTDELPPRARTVLDRVGRLADGWVPLVYSASAKRRLEPAMLARGWELVLESAARAGRRRADVDFVYSDWCYVLDGPGSEARCRDALARFFSGTWEEARRTYTIGTVDSVVEQIATATAGIDRVDAYVLTPLGGEIEQLDALARVRAALVP